MKKILILIFCIIMFVSCTKYNKCGVNYSIVYPDTTINYDTIFEYKYTDPCYYKVNPHMPYTSSDRGSNYIRLGDWRFGETTCPIRINSYEMFLEK